MKKTTFLCSLGLLSLGLLTASAQFGPPGRGNSNGPRFSGAITKLFGDNSAFTASLEFQTSDPSSGGDITMPGKISFDAGKSRFEMNLADLKGSKLPPNAAAQMKAMGMDRTVVVSRPDKKVSDIIYPGMQSYLENPLPDEAAAPDSDFKVETTELGKETVDGHDCIKNQVVVTDKDGKSHESVVWNANDLKKFPVKIETTEQGRRSVMLFRDVSLTKPDGNAFEVPADYTKYTSMQAMVQQIMMKQMGGMGIPQHP